MNDFEKFVAEFREANKDLSIQPEKPQDKKWMVAKKVALGVAIFSVSSALAVAGSNLTPQDSPIVKQYFVNETQQSSPTPAPQATAQRSSFFPGFWWWFIGRSSAPPASPPTQVAHASEPAKSSSAAGGKESSSGSSGRASPGETSRGGFGGRGGIFGG